MGGLGRVFGRLAGRGADNTALYIFIALAVLAAAAAYYYSSRKRKQGATAPLNFGGAPMQAAPYELQAPVQQGWASNENGWPVR